MAQRTVVYTYDDISGEQGEDVETVPFALGGKTYEIDLGPENHDKLVDALNPFTLNAQAYRNGSEGCGRTRKSTQGGSDTAKVRTWAKEQGYEVNDRGRVPASIKEAYEKAH